jgi:glucose-6-phosphate isomerase
MLITFAHQDALVSSENFSQYSSSLKNYARLLQEVVSSGSYEAPESSINLPSDQKLLNNVLDMKSKKTSPRLRYIIDIGIGGSNLGTKAVYDALHGYYDIVQPDRLPKIIFLDTVSEDFYIPFSSLMESINNKEEILINAISKSGGTTETIVNLEVVLELLQKKFPDIKQRVVITTDENSKLWHRAKELNIDLLPIPKQVGGRYSVLSAAELFPLACAGIHIERLLKGAEEMRTVCISTDLKNNPAALSAAIMYFHAQNGRTISDSFFFAPQLESIGKWYRQLMAESIGKENDLQGNIVHAGITPTVSVGSTDLHSVGQLYLSGPRDKTTTFIYTTNEPAMVAVPSTLQFPLVEGIENKKLRDIMKAILEGVKIAYKKQELPFMEVALETITEQSLGEFLQLKMIEIMYLGKLFNINTFDQPHVELYKVETKRILNG